MSSIDTRIVELKLNNTQFMRGISETKKALDDLNKNLKFDGAAKGAGEINKAVRGISFNPLQRGIDLVRTGFDRMSTHVTGIFGRFNREVKFDGAVRGLGEVNKAAQNVDLSPLTTGADTIGARFSNMSVVATAALATIAHQATMYGMQITKSLALDSVMDGFSDYELKIGATQTIMAGTGESIGSVTKHLKELDIYADQTIYSLSDMVSNIGKFTNAGVKLPVAVNAMKGISNVAALSGASTGEASRAMYNLGQAIGQGTVKLMDWRSVELANMGTKEFKEELIKSGVAMGTLKKATDGTLTTTKGTEVTFKNFSSTLQDGWLTAEALTDTLGRYADENEAIGKKAYKAAKDVKSFSMMVETLKAAMGTGWTDTFDIIVGNLPEAKELFTNISNVFGEMVAKSAESRNKMFQDWKDLGGRTAIIQSFANVWKALGSVLGPIRAAFRDIFPAMTGARLAEISKGIQSFTEKLKMGAQTSTNLKRTFRGVFAVFGIGWEVIKQVARVFAELFGVASSGGGGFLAFTAKIGDFFVRLHKSVKEGDALKTFFTGLTSVLKVPIALFKTLLSAVQAFFTGLSGSSISNLTKDLTPLGKIGEVVKKGLSGAKDALENFFDMFDGSGDAVKKLVEGIGKAFGGISFNDILGGVSIGGFLVLVKSIKDFVGIFKKTEEEVTETLDKIKTPFKSLTDTLDVMQNTLRAATLLQIAAAVGILALSVVALSKVDADGLQRALTAMTIMFIQLTAAMAVFQKIDIGSGMFQLILMATAINILANAVRKLAALSWNELAKGLVGTTVLIGGLAAAARLMPDGKKMISSSLGLLVLSGAIKVLVSAVKDMASIGWEELSRGLVGVGALLTGLILFTKFQQANKGGMIQSVGLLILAAAIKVLASALDDLGDMAWDEIGRGLTAMAGGLTLISVALALLPPTSLFSAAAIFVVAASLGMIGDAMQQMGGMSWEEVAKGLVVLAGSLTIIAIAMNAMTTAIFGAAALVVVAAALGMLVPVLESFGNMDVGEIVKSLIMLAGALAIISIAMNSMTTAIFGAAALLVVAAALAVLTPVLIALGNMSWGEIIKSLIMLAAAITVLGLTTSILGLLSPLMVAFGVAVAILGVGILALGVGLLATATAFRIFAAAGEAGINTMLTLIQGLIAMIPQIATALAEGVIAFAKVIGTAGPAITKAITAVLSAFLDAIRKVAPKAIKTFTEIMIGLLGAVRKLSPQIILTIMTLMRDLLGAIDRYMPYFVTKGADILIKFLNGIASKMRDIVTAATNVIVAFINGITNNLDNIIQAGVRLIIAFVNGVANAIRDHQDEMNAAGRNLASAIVQGMASGIRNGLDIVTSAARSLASNALGAAMRVLDINSPSKAFMRLGKSSAQGYAMGLTGNKEQVTKAIKDMYTQMKEVKKSTADDIKTIEARLKRLKSARRKDYKEINKANKALAQARLEKKRVERADAVRRSKPYQKKEDQLLGLAKRKDKLSASIDEAKKKLADAKKVRDDYKKQVYDQYRDLPDFDKETKLADYVKDFQKQIIDTQIYTSQLAELRKRGLNNQMYQELVAKGPEAIPFVTQILEGGKTSVKELNTLGSALSKSASKLASNASTALYQAGVNAAQGLVMGLEKKKKAIQKQMDRIAYGMVHSIKKALGIKSPSRELMKVGNWSVEGLAKGLSDVRPAVQATEATGTAIVESMRKSISGLSDILDGAMDGDPTIRPVLDLTQVKKDAGAIDGILGVGPINPGGSYSSAAQVSALYTKLAAEKSESSVETPSERVVENITYIQNNNSPKALSSAEIYRQTKNQISTAKGALSK